MWWSCIIFILTCHTDLDLRTDSVYVEYLLFPCLGVCLGAPVNLQQQQQITLLDWHQPKCLQDSREGWEQKPARGGVRSSVQLEHSHGNTPSALPASPGSSSFFCCALCARVWSKEHLWRQKLFILSYPDFSSFSLISVISWDLDAENILLGVFLSLTSALSSSHHIPLSTTILQSPPGNLPLSQAMTSHQTPHPLLPVPPTSPLAGFSPSHSSHPYCGKFLCQKSPFNPFILSSEPVPSKNEFPHPL